MKNLFSILVVDDDEHVREVLTMTLEIFGYQVLSASSANEAIELLNTKNIKMVISDMRMPEMDGMGLLRYVRTKVSKSMPFMLITGFSEYTRDQAIENGATYFFEKPVTTDSLLKVVNSEIARCEQQWNDRPRRIEGNFAVRLKNGDATATALNLSMGGMYIDACDANPLIDDSVQFELVHEGKVVQGKGVVRWIRYSAKNEEGKSAPVGVGIQFDTVPTNMSELISAIA